MPYILFFGVAGIAVLMGLFAALRAYRKSQFGEAAAELGLEAKLPASKRWSMSGQRGGRWVRVWMSHEFIGMSAVRDEDGNKIGEAPDYRWFTNIRIQAQPMTDGLQILRVGALARLTSSLFGEDDWDIHDDALRTAFDFGTDRPLFERAREVLRVPAVHRALRPIAELDLKLQLKDAVAAYRKPGRVTSKKTIVETVERTLVLLDALEAAGAQVADRRARLLDEWVEVADQLGWEREGDAISGDVSDVSMTVFTWLEEEERVTVVRADIEPPFCTKVKLERTGTLDRMLDKIGAGDLKTGDPDFDAHFELRGQPSARVVKALREDVREGLMRLDAEGRVALEPSRVTLTVEEVVRDRERLVRLIRDVHAVAAGLSPRARSHGPFR